MDKFLYNVLTAAFLLCASTAASAMDISVDTTTILRFEQRDVIGLAKRNLEPATQIIGLEINKLADGNLSLHLHGWGRADLGDKSFNDSATAGNLTYGFLQYRLKYANADLRAGRFAVREGVVNEYISHV